MSDVARVIQLEPRSQYFQAASSVFFLLPVQGSVLGSVPGGPGLWLSTSASISGSLQPDGGRKGS